MGSSGHLGLAPCGMRVYSVAKSCPTLCNLKDSSLCPSTKLLCPMNFPCKNIRPGLPFPPPGDLSDQGLNLNVLHWQADSLPLSHRGSLQAKNQMSGLSEEVRGKG